MFLAYSRNVVRLNSFERVKVRLRGETWRDARIPSKIGIWVELETKLL